MEFWARHPGLPDPKKAATGETGRLWETLQARRIIFWIWPHLTHQMTLVCLLDWYAAGGYQSDLCLINSGRFPNRHDRDTLLAFYEDLIPLTEKHVQMAREVWSALRQPTPEKLLDIVRTGPVPCLPHQTASHRQSR
jgi:hypothetical protein